MTKTVKRTVDVEVPVTFVEARLVRSDLGGWTVVLWEHVDASFTGAAGRRVSYTSDGDLLDGLTEQLGLNITPVVTWRNMTAEEYARAAKAGEL